MLLGRGWRRCSSGARLEDVQAFGAENPPPRASCRAELEGTALNFLRQLSGDGASMGDVLGSLRSGIQRPGSMDNSGGGSPDPDPDDAAVQGRASKAAPAAEAGVSPGGATGRSDQVARRPQR